MTWIADESGCHVFFNRDERRSRLPADPPRVHRRGGVRFLAPEDGDHGGTWIAVNEHGLSLCLLNGFTTIPLDRPEDAFTSRGLLPLALIEAERTAEAASRLETTDLRPFRPFVLAAIRPRERSWLATWSGRDLTLDEEALADQPVVSSSFFTEEVRRSRRAVYARLLADGADDRRVETHLAFHESHEPRRGSHSPCMHREDARTVSFSWIHVEADAVHFSYVGDSPCRRRPGAPVASLERVS